MKRIFHASMIAIALGLTGAAYAEVSVGVQLGVPGVDVYYSTVPPPPIVEAVPAPRMGYVWAPGYWRWNGERHVWMPGVWVQERPGYAWIAPRWVRGDRGWYMEEGRWMGDRDAYHERERHHEEEERWEHMRREDYRHAEERHRDEGWDERHEHHRDHDRD
ncbi:MAG: YXWGXW repeat-containing protein [Burkholderiales bacterium]|nr:YXWGXW repeat-containing protein [Burkholderiales bacterium]